MTYKEALNFLYTQLPMYQRSGQVAFREDIGNIVALTEAMDNPHTKLKSIHIAGTNGKGSSAHMLASVLQAAGYKTGLYTSPHLKEFTERIRINGTEIGQDHVVNFVEQHRDLIAAVEPSFFEMTVAMAFKYFADEQVDIAVIEVGLGGRLDSTNIVTPEVSLITNIGLDHQNLLGNSVEKIASEKAGIIKKNVPVVIGQKQELVNTIFEKKAATSDTTIYFASDDYQVEKLNGSRALTEFAILGTIFGSYELDLLGDYQLLNLPGVIKVLELLRQGEFEIPNQAIRSGLKNVCAATGLKGRWQILQERPLVVCDTGHNADGLKCIIDQLKRQKNKNLFFVLGTVNDKQLDTILCLLPQDAFYYFCSPGIPRGLDAQELSKAGAKYGLKGQVVSDVNEALACAKQEANDEDLIFVGGSTFTVAEIEGL